MTKKIKLGWGAAVQIYLRSEMVIVKWIPIMPSRETVYLENFTKNIESYLEHWGTKMNIRLQKVHQCNKW